MLRGRLKGRMHARGLASTRGAECSIHGAVEH